MWQGPRYPPTKLPALPVPRALPNPLALPANPAGLAPAPCQEARKQNEPPPGALEKQHLPDPGCCRRQGFGAVTSKGSGVRGAEGPLQSFQ